MDAFTQFSPSKELISENESLKPKDSHIKSLNFSDYWEQNEISEEQGKFHQYFSSIIFIESKEKHEVGWMTTQVIATEDIGVNTNFYEMSEINIQQSKCNCTSVNTNKLSVLEQKVLALEEKLTEANNKIWGLALQLNEEKAKNWKISISTTSDESKKIDSGSFEKFIFKSGKFTSKGKPPLKRNRSSDVHFQSKFNQIQNESVEDEEFKKFEAQALYEAKIDTITSKKSQKEILNETLQELKSTGRSMNIPIMISSFQDSSEKDLNTKQNDKVDWKNEYLQI